MSKEFEFEGNLESWLAEGPNQLPDRALASIIAGLEDVPRRRLAWLPSTDAFRRLVLAAGSLAAVVLLALVGLALLSSGPIGPGASPTRTPDSTVLFTSDRHGYSVLLPSNRWRVIESAGEWAPGTVFDVDRPGVDLFVYVGAPGERYLHEVFLSSQPIPVGMTFDDWFTDYHQNLAGAFPGCQRVSGYENASVDGETARVSEHTCGAQRWAQAVWSHEGRGYGIRVGEFVSSDVDIDPRTEVESWLGRITHTN